MLGALHIIHEELASRHFVLDGAVAGLVFLFMDYIFTYVKDVDGLCFA